MRQTAMRFTEQRLSANENRRVLEKTGRFSLGAGDTSMSAKWSVLVVEDNADNRTLMMDLFTSLGYDVFEAPDGEQGVRLAFEKKPSLILMDLSLPEKDGWQAARELKADPETAKIPIIALTAHAMRGDRERALEAGCDDYLAKPINLMELLDTIKKYIEV
jgi:two-component system cell cycle response regulator DivK